MLAHRIAVITHLVLAFHVTVCDFHPLQETVLFSLSHSWHSIKAPLLTHTHTHTQSNLKRTKSQLLKIKIISSWKPSSWNSGIQIFPYRFHIASLFPILCSPNGRCSQQ